MAEAENTAFREILGRTVVEWEIKDFTNFHPGNGIEMSSPTFWVSNAGWAISFYPEGETSDVKEFVSLYLWRLIGEDPIFVSFTLSIMANNFVVGKTDYEETFNADDSCGSDDFVKRSKILKRLTPATSKDTITVMCSIRVPNSIQKEIFTQTPSSYKSIDILTKNLEDIFHNQKLSDVKLKVGTRDFTAHKAILAARSPVFSSMFEHEMRESMDGIVDIIDCDGDSFELFLKFLYNGHVEKTTNANSLGLYKIADKYCIKDLKEICCSFMSESLEIDSICDVLDMAITHDEAEVIKVAIDFFTMNATEIFVTEKWQKFMFEKISMANEILRQMAARANISLNTKTGMK